MSETLFLAAFSWYPFSGLPPAIQVLFSIAFLIILMMLVWTGILFFLGLEADRNPPDPGGEEDSDWIFLVPALNEEVTIRDSVERLEQVPLERKRIVVINDGSDDGTGEVLRRSTLPISCDAPGTPDARKGKAAALNFACRRSAGGGGVDPDRTIISWSTRMVVSGRRHASSPAISQIRWWVGCRRWSASTTVTVC